MNRSTVERGVMTSIAKWTWPVCMSKVFCLCFVCDLTKVGELTKVARQPSERVTQLLPVAWTSQRLGGSLTWACRGSYLGVQGALSGHTRVSQGLQGTISGPAGDPIWACRGPYLGVQVALSGWIWALCGLGQGQDGGYGASRPNLTL